jgi:CRP/FNR family transcriptional regulator, cyclic AMP receptor protein
VVAILGPDHFFGEGCLNGHPLRIATTRAMDECVITRLEKATMFAAIHNEPEFSELLTVCGHAATAVHDPGCVKTRCWI